MSSFLLKYFKNNIAALRLARACKKVSFDASMTLEAAIVLPLFIFFIVICLYPLKILDDMQVVQQTMEEECESAAKAMYTLSLVQSEDDDKDTQRVNADDSIVTVRHRYDYKYPFVFFNIKDSSQYMVSSHRAWVGRTRGQEEPVEESESSEEEDPWVYVGKNGTRYHIDPNCHYISNDYRSLDLVEAVKAKNKFGEFYKRCERCTKKMPLNHKVYVTPGGSCYHADKNCTAMISYPEQHRLSEVEHLGACSYCGNKQK